MFLLSRNSQGREKMKMSEPKRKMNNTWFSGAITIFFAMIAEMDLVVKYRLFYHLIGKLLKSLVIEIHDLTGGCKDFRFGCVFDLISNRKLDDQVARGIVFENDSTAILISNTGHLGEVLIRFGFPGRALPADGQHEGTKKNDAETTICLMKRGHSDRPHLCVFTSCPVI